MADTTVLTAEQEIGKGSGKYEGMSTWGYVGSVLLMCIPVLGLIISLIWALGGCRKYAKRNLARAMIILTIITLIISVGCYFVFERYLKDASLDEILALPFVNTIMEKVGVTPEQIKELGSVSQELAKQGMNFSDLMNILPAVNG